LLLGCFRIGVPSRGKIETPGALPDLDSSMMWPGIEHCERPTDRLGNRVGLNILGGFDAVLVIQEIASVHVHYCRVVLQTATRDIALNSWLLDGRFFSVHVYRQMLVPFVQQFTRTRPRSRRTSEQGSDTRGGGLLRRRWWLSGEAGRLGNAALCRSFVDGLADGMRSNVALPNSRGNAPIAQTLDRDFGLVAGDLAHPGTLGDAVFDPQTQRFSRRLGIGGKGDIDKVDHLTLHTKSSADAAANRTRWLVHQIRRRQFLW
jgi:hypothetical protein